MKGGSGCSAPKMKIQHMLVSGSKDAAGDVPVLPHTTLEGGDVNLLHYRVAALCNI